MKDLKSVSLVVVIAAASGALAFLAATASNGRRTAILETKVSALEARLDTEAQAKQKAAQEAIDWHPPVVYPDSATWEALTNGRKNKAEWQRIRDDMIRSAPH